MNQRSSRHSISTYKDKYILKFGGVAIPIEGIQGDPIRYASYPEVYSLEREEWSTINLKQNNDMMMEIGTRPVIFKNESNNLLLILGGDPLVGRRGEYRPAFELHL